ncbi:MAG: hypothetical protein ACRD8W_03395 [Nitrososphaeraceae archaeon]
MSNNINHREQYKDYVYRTSDTFKRPHVFKDFVEREQNCNQCGEPIIVEYGLRTHEVLTYELDPYPDQRIEHKHKADPITKASLISGIAVEMRYLYEVKVN